MNHWLIALAILSISSAPALSCPSKPQNIKVIDLKSGWWQGDGGDTDSYVIRHITQSCPNVKIHYQHRLGGYGGGSGGLSFNPKEMPPENKPEGEPGDFDQIWLLSGAESDGADLRIESPEFLGYLNSMVKSSGNLFVGTGFGNIYHANSLTSALGLGNLMLTNRETHDYPSPTNGVQVVSSLQKENLSMEHGLFKNMNSTLSDIVQIGDFQPPSDSLLDSNIVKKLAQANGGQTVIGEVSFGNRKMILDGNLARTYLIRQNDSSIQNYLVNLATVLEH